MPPKIIKTYIPDRLRRCANAPKVPVGRSTQKEVATYVVGLHGAYRNCKANLGVVNRILTEQEAEIDAASAEVVE